MCFIELVTLVLEGVDTPLVVDEQHGPAHGGGGGTGCFITIAYLLYILISVSKGMCVPLGSPEVLSGMSSLYFQPSS